MVVDGWTIKDESDAEATPPEDVMALSSVNFDQLALGSEQCNID